MQQKCGNCPLVHLDGPTWTYADPPAASSSSPSSPSSYSPRQCHCQTDAAQWPSEKTHLIPARMMVSNERTNAPKKSMSREFWRIPLRGTRAGDSLLLKLGKG
ncbi:hypothetical protein Pla52n_49590 [Stieleria varia]|uniref:Uncharacterized protein n=1 Tax=Stieleria varia TaxID=2528005 RepID=A0A5C6AGY8_9BACT|nr:hypothetical protein Pla52n_49590 [Stieleria varia]